MTLTFGRAVLPDPSQVSPSGGGILSLSGPLFSTDTTAADRATFVQMTEMQLLGCVNNPDEDVFPLVWTAESKFDGFYRCLDASVDYQNDGSGRLAFATYSLTLELLDTQVVFETTTVAVQRHATLTPTAATTSTYVDDVHYPSGANYDPSALASISRTGTDGVVISTTRSTTLPWTYTQQVFRSAGTFYVGACAIEIQGEDSAWYKWTGRTLPQSAAGKWRLTNTLFRVGCNASTVGDLDFQVYDATAAAWEGYTARPVTYGVVGTSWTDELFFAQDIGGAEWALPDVVCNSPSKVILACTANVLSTGGNRPARQTLTLRAGTHHVEYNNSVGSIASFFHRGVELATPLAGSTAALTDAMQASSTDASGNRYVLAVARNSQFDTTNGRIRLAASNNGAFMLGIVKNAAAPATGDSASEIVNEWAVGVAQSSAVVPE
jgi:hypothetical protein